MNISIELTAAQADALKLVGVENPSELAGNVVASAIKGKLNYFINGATVKTAGESTHSVVKVSKAGVRKTVYYNGGLRATAGAGYDMAKKYLPKEITREVFIAGELEEANLILSTLTAKDGDGKDEDESGE